MSSPRKKMKTTSSITSLPYDLLLSCLARVSRLYYPTLTLVSKSFRSLITSPEIYKRRSLLGCTESCLYLCLPCEDDLNHRWFTLYRRPDKTLNSNNNLRKKSSGNLFVPIHSPIHRAQLSNYIAVGSKIYGIGSDGWTLSSRVSVLDCQYNTWGKAPRMRVKRSYNLTASVVDGKIYVAGGSKKSLELVEVFAPKTQTWSSMTMMNTDTKKDDLVKVRSLGLEGNLHLLIPSYFRYDEEKHVVYNPKEGKWNPVGLNEMMSLDVFSNYCVVDNVLFHGSSRSVSWYNSKVDAWTTLKIEGLPYFTGCESWKIADYGGNLVVFWDDVCYCNDGNHKNMIWCAEISLERRNGDEIWGKVKWFDVVLKVPPSCLLSKAIVLSATA